MSQVRLHSLDVLRGLAVALMIVVNTPGSWAHIYAPLRHADWHGFTPTDLVFPLFLSVMGSAMALSLGAAKVSRALLWRIGRRTLLLIAIGLVLNAFPFTTAPEYWRLPGVLQRIGLCYGLVALFVLMVPRRWWLWATALLAVFYAALLHTGGYALADNLARRLDLFLFGPDHLWQGKGLAFDPEGLLTTVGACLTVLAGFFSMYYWRQLPAAQQVRHYGLAALLLLSAGLLLDSLIPINKSLWTLSYVAYAQGWIFTLTAVLLWWLDTGQKMRGQWLRCFAIPFGSNALFIYVVSWLWVVIYWHIPAGNSNLYDALFEWLASLTATAEQASLLFALLHLGLFWWLAYWLYQRRIFIKL